MTRIFFLPDRNFESPVARLRGQGFAEELARRGFETAVLWNPVPVRWDRSVDVATPIAHGLVGWRRELARVERADVLYAVRIQDVPFLPFAAIVRTKVVGAKLVYDFDDSVHVQDPWMTRLLCRAADHVVIAGQGNMAYAQRHAREWGIVPTPYDPADYPPAAPDPATKVIGWSGTPSNLAWLFEKKKALAEVCRRTGAVVRVVTRLPADRLPLPPPFEYMPWDLATYRGEIAKFHVGISPLPDTPWTRGKLAYKIIECQACGVPGVASPVVAKDEIILDGETGYYADSYAEWLEALERLLTDEPLRRRMAKRARAHAESRFSLRAAGDKLEPIIRSVIAH